MRRARTGLGVNLTVSLHAARDAVRNEIMPINRKYPLAELTQACREYLREPPIPAGFSSPTPCSTE